jgi:L-alanine-DL-glutamate epimerase-like enolase superfamily enzyme
VPLIRLLGGTPRPDPAYNSCGLGLIGAERAAAEALQLAAPGFKAIKVRLGYERGGRPRGGARRAPCGGRRPST